MAVAGGAAQSIELQIIDNQLWQTGKLYRLSEYLTTDVDEAIDKLARGERVMFKALGPAIVRIRERLQALGVEVLEPVEASYKLPGKAD